ncbi:lysoplasmalogenase [Lacinutrix sp. C3R15]|uniref:lysoplasmalogenase family protein n=1 Tax=Flavobacteriaceae TaxID=49546 RepID=UPI001C08C022|nr:MULTISPECIES: lysoplasmalogenase family protein [Flavobacteriaceae]MBU2938889.1 lysoplasmalogenase [Lacinutrix sp. C3R15]MDO6622202.1 lysoplasmalogenase family protein [Oceanihabitans sp. 1_MG-2023]
MLIFKNKLFFSILYFAILLIDIVVKLNFDKIPFRLFTKPLVVVSLICFYLINNNEKSKKKYFFMIFALSFFLLGDIFLIFSEFSILFSLGMLGFVLGKLFYAFRFSNHNDFNLTRLIPIIIFCFIYIFILLNIIYDNLDIYFFPVLIYLFVAMLVLQFAYLRKSGVDKKSYLIVGIGVLFSVFADTIAVLDHFYRNGIFFEKITLMLFYSISQFLIVMGILEEKIITDNLFSLQEIRSENKEEKLESSTKNRKVKFNHSNIEYDNNRLEL